MCLGIPGKVTEVYGAEGLQMGMVDFGGVRREVCLAYVADEVEAGDYVIVHVGFAISRVDEEEARRTFELLEEISELDELEWMKEVAEQSLSVLESGKDASPPAAPDPTPPTGPS
ncbi:MAG: HypC/HybG/HupF family hydrogenase formation chaperone [marine benthic group bacterium]|nr:HypC/HybG/HupF family hydrogenase formation chaperone [Gemmatimonadota bacterium]